MRHLSMANFRTPHAVAEIAKLNADNKKGRLHVGQIVGQIDGVVEKTFRNEKDQKDEVSKRIIGEFEAVSIAHDTGAIGDPMQSETLFMPSYFFDVCKGGLERSGGQPIFLACDIFMLTEPKSSTGYAYDVVSRRSRQAGNRLDAMKAEMAKAGLLKLPAPAAAMLEAPIANGSTNPDYAGKTIDADPETGEIIDGEAGVDEADAAEAASKAPKGRKAA